MHPEEEIDERFIGDNIRIVSDLDCLSMSSRSGTNLSIGWICSVASSIADNDLFQFVSKVSAIEMFGA
jgi:hypothetical protein